MLRIGKYEGWERSKNQIFPMNALGISFFQTFFSQIFCLPIFLPFVLPFVFWLSYSVFHVLPFMFCLSCSAKSVSPPVCGHDKSSMCLIYCNEDMQQNFYGHKNLVCQLRNKSTWAKPQIIQPNWQP